MRKRLPDRRSCWTQKVRILDENSSPQTIFLTCGERGDGTLGEIWLTMSKVGTFLRGVLDALARSVSASLQCGTPIEEVVKSLRSLNFPPHGVVDGSPFVTACSSIADWVAQELEHAYILKTEIKVGEGIPEKIAGAHQRGNGV